MSTTHIDAAERSKLADHFRSVLRHEAAHRRHRENLIDGTPEWVLAERAAMIDAVQKERRRRGLPDVDPEHVRRGERQAEGHIDYAKKWAYTCADLVLNTRS